MPMMGGFGIVFAIIYLGVVIYFFTLLSKISKSLQRIAEKIEQINIEEK